MVFSHTFSLSRVGADSIDSLLRESLDSLSSVRRRFTSMFWSHQGRAQAYLDYLLSELDPMLSQKRLAAEVVSIERETFETSTIVLRPPSRWKGFEPGQYITLEVEIDGVRYRRNYSLSCSPKYFEETGKFSITVKTVNKGKVSDFVNRSICVSDVVHISEARGQFTLPVQIDELKESSPVFVAGGSGITPIRSMIDHLLETVYRDSGEGAEEIVLIHYAKNTDDIIFQNHFERLAERHKKFRYIKCLSDIQGNVNAKQLKKACASWKGKSLYMCGPAGFMSAVREMACSLSVSEDAIHSESFGGGLHSFVDVEEVEEGLVNFSFAGRQVQSNGKQSLLELAELAGLAPKFGCRSGICHECKCHRPKGRLFNRMTGHPISEDQTHVQSCVAVPSGNLTLKQW